jgi:hypothetical protein
MASPCANVMSVEAMKNEKTYMSEVTIIGADLAQLIFQLQGG